VQGNSPAFTVDTVQDRTAAEDDRIARRVEGTITVPCFLTNGCQPGGRFTFDRRGRPEQRGTTTFRWYCNVPRSALDPAAPPKALAAGRSPFANPWWGLRRIPSYPYEGSALVWWDSGTPPPPLINQPNRKGQDPHSHPRSDPAARRQKSEFLKVGGAVVDVCGGGPCFANGYSGP
jgi:hypothetical protein